VSVMVWFMVFSATFNSVLTLSSLVPMVQVVSEEIEM
jgi:hypothetical protein